MKRVVSYERERGVPETKHAFQNTLFEVCPERGFGPENILLQLDLHP